MLGIEPRGEVRFRISGDKVELLPPALTFEETFGSVKKGTQPLDFKKMREVAIEDHVQAVVNNPHAQEQRARNQAVAEHHDHRAFEPLGVEREQPDRDDRHMRH